MPFLSFHFTILPLGRSLLFLRTWSRDGRALEPDFSFGVPGVNQAGGCLLWGERRARRVSIERRSRES